MSLRTLLIGAGGISRGHLSGLAELPAYRVVAVADLREEAARERAAPLGAAVHTDARAALAAEKPEVVVVTTSNNSHAALAMAAARTPGVRAVVCEKPMATRLEDARAMVEACREAGVVLIVNHQRRLGPDLTTMRRLILEGALGEVLAYRGWCAGDLLSDGTHLIDSLQFLAGDPHAEWALGRVIPSLEPHDRFGHVVEDGAEGLAQLATGARLEIWTGSERGARVYQEYEIVGTRGRLWRLDDLAWPNVYLTDAAGGDQSVRTLLKGYGHEVKPLGRTCPGYWRAVDPGVPARPHGIRLTYEHLLATLATGAPHPCDGATALRGFEILMALYESARRGDALRAPFLVEGFPLETMAGVAPHDTAVDAFALNTSRALRAAAAAAATATPPRP